MIMPFALAVDGYINIIPVGAISAQTTNFLDTIKKIFPFTDTDLMEFDGNSFKVISKYDPTNSIFIYTNDQGTFLYKVTSATPYIHKNKKIWFCNCFEMENVEDIESLLTEKTSAQDPFGVVADIQKNIAHSYINPPSTYPTFTERYYYKVENKANFRTSSIDKYFIGGSIFNDQDLVLKLKFMVNPTTDNTLISKSRDGSFNFLFPLKAKGTPTLYQLPTITSSISDGNITITMADILKNYSSNLKSVEVLPFNCANKNFGTSKYTYVESSNDLLTITVSGTAKFTDCGIFIEQGFTEFFDLVSLSQDEYPKQLLLGGGMKSFIQTPLGDIQLDNSSVYYDLFTKLVCAIKEDGWKIDGFGKADVPPHYLNFYTDETGQLFIQNMTTNAQELRNINRTYTFKENEIQQEYVLSQVKNAETLDIFNPKSWFSVAQGALADYTQFEFDKAKAQRDYSLAKVEYEDKIKTQSLLASMTGKTIGGNFSIVDFLIALNSKPFILFIEKNFFRQRKLNTNSAVNNLACYVVQQDYDYSVNTVNENFYFNQFNCSLPYLIVGNGHTTTPHWWGDIGRFVMNIFGGYVADGGVSYQPMYEDEIGLNYTIQFKLANFINGTHGIDDYAKMRESRLLNFQVRTSKK